MGENEPVSPSTEEPGSAPLRSLGRSTLLMASGTFVSRGLGFVRNAMLAAAIGVNAYAANAYDVANKIPNALYAVVAAGVLNAVLVPQIVRAFRRADGKRTVDRIVTLGVFGSLGLTLLFTLAAPAFVMLYTQGWSDAQRGLAIGFAFWCIPQLFFYSVYTILGQVLNAKEQFGPYMWAPVLNNVVSIAGLVAYLAIYGTYVVDPDVPVGVLVEEAWGPAQIALLAGTATLGIAAQALILIWPLRRGGYRWNPVWGGPPGELKGITSVAGWALGAVLLDQVGVVYVTRIASAASQGTQDPSIAGNAAYFNAMMLYLLPHSLIIVSIITALATRMASHAAAGDRQALRATAVRGMRSVTVFGLWSTAVLVALAPAIVRIALPTQTVAEVRSVAYVLMALALGGVPLGLLGVFKYVFFALEDGKAVFYIQIPVTVAWLGGILLAHQLLPNYWWTAGAALALSVSNVIGVALRADGVRRRVGGLDVKRYAWMAARALAAAALAGALGWWLLRYMPVPDASDRVRSLLATGAVLAALVPLMAIAYWALLRLMRVPEAAELAAPLRKRLRRRVR